MDTDFAHLEVLLLPCNYVHDYMTDWGDSIAPECISDLNKQKEYLREIHFLQLFNEVRFDPEKYNGEELVKESKIVN